MVDELEVVDVVRDGVACLPDVVLAVHLLHTAPGRLPEPHGPEDRGPVLLRPEVEGLALHLGDDLEVLD